MITVERYHDISMGHRVVGHESKCRHLHGHNYRIHFVCTAPELDGVGRVIDFSEIKERLCQWLEEPTAEQIAMHLVSVVGPQQLEGTGITLEACRVEETRKCSASYQL